MIKEHVNKKPAKGECDPNYRIISEVMRHLFYAIMDGMPSSFKSKDETTPNTVTPL